MRTSELIRAIVKAIIEPRLIYSALYPAAIAAQDSGGLVDVLPDGDEVRGQGLAKVRLGLGLPGWRAKVPPGVRCLLGWGGASPAAPVAHTFDAGCAVTELAFDGGTNRVARKDDPTKTVKLYLQTAGPALWYEDPSAGWLPIDAGVAPPMPTNGTKVPGTITDGCPKLLA